MVLHHIRRLGPVVVAATVILPGCGKSPQIDLDQGRSPDRAGAVNQVAARADAFAHANAAKDISPKHSPNQQTPPEDWPPWPIAPLRNPNVNAPVASLDPSVLAEWLHDPDPIVRLHALDAWALHPGVSLDPVTYAMVDPDESVRARAQELLDQELGRR